MGTVKRSPRSLFRNFVLHLLAFAVVVFASEAKLSLYNPSPEPWLAAAKLSTETNSSKFFSAIGNLEQPKTPAYLDFVAVELLAYCQGSPAALPVHSALMSLFDSERLHHEGISRFHRPPPLL